MSIHPILIAPDPRLRQVATPVAAVDDAVRRLLDDMLETMYDAPGIGLAAVQIGIMKRLVVLDVSGEEEERKPLRLINPEVTWQSDDKGTYEEGCLSIPGVFEAVDRPARCRVSYLDETGAQQEIEADGLLATCLQHEIDHLDGKLFIDYLSRLKREMILRKMKKYKKAQGLEPAPADHSL